ncbi:peptidase S8/S53 domain-containing protein, partial [Mycena leptocephala]
YSLPAPLTQHVEFFHPTTIFAPPIDSRPKFVAASPARRAAPNSDDFPFTYTRAMTPACLQRLYGIPTTPATQKSNTLGVAGFIDEWANQADLTAFFTSLRTDINSSTTFAVEALDGGSNPQNRSQAGVEADLDTQYTIGIATGVPVIFISAGDDNPDGLNGFLDMILLLISDPNRPSVLTTSYSFQAETDLPISVAINLCNTYMQLGALGTSLLFAQAMVTSLRLAPPASTYSTEAGKWGRGSPLEVSCWFTLSVLSYPNASSGFSNYFPIPNYQAEDIKACLAFLDSFGSKLPENGRFNRSGRGFPDVSAQGEKFEIAWDNLFGTVDGTSCSTPTFASVITLLNDELVAAGRPTLGFLNPFLYSPVGGAVLNDVILGENPGCGTEGFFANAGWDAVAGMGTPNYTALRTAVGLRR